MTTNASPEYLGAQKRFLAAISDEEKLVSMEEMLKYMPGHKGAEAMRANLRQRYKKLKESIETKKKKKSRSGKQGIRKEEMQAVLIGLTGSGKSSLLSVLTNASPLISSFPYTTKQPFLGTIDHKGAKVQLIDMPAIDFQTFDQGIANTADTLIIVIEKVDQLEKIKKYLERSYGKQIIVFNKIDLLNSQEKRKLESRLKSKKLNFVMISCKTGENLEELKDKIWLSFDKIRIYTKEPGRKADSDPVVLDTGSSVRDIAEKILHGLSKKVKETKVTGPSSKFANQKVSLKHILKDKDIVEFHLS